MIHSSESFLFDSFSLILLSLKQKGMQRCNHVFGAFITLIYGNTTWHNFDMS